MKTVLCKNCGLKLMGVYKDGEVRCNCDNTKPQLFSSNVNHPSHYQSKEMEVIDIIEEYELNFNLGNACKYLLRAGKKDSNKYIEDLEKLIWYVQREINNERS